jgi:hypothetical protein
VKNINYLIYRGKIVPNKFIQQGCSVEVPICHWKEKRRGQKFSIDKLLNMLEVIEFE